MVIDMCTTLSVFGEHEIRLVTFRMKNDYAFATKGLRIDCLTSTVVPSVTGKWKIDIAELQLYINNFKPDVIHSHLFETEMVLSQVNCGNALRVMHFHDNMPQLARFSWKTCLSKQKFTNWFERYIVLKNWKNIEKRCAIAIAEDSLNYARHVLDKETVVHKVLNGISVNRFTPAQPKVKTLQLCMIGSLVEKKGQALAIRVIKNLHEKGFSFHLHLLGDGPKRKELETLTTELELTYFIHFQGNIDHPEVFLHRAFVYLHTANYEPLGLVLLEAMAAETPVVCSDGRGNRDLIEHGKNGFIFKQPDPSELADQIIELWQNAPLYNSIQHAAKDFVKDFDMSLYCSRLVALYRSHL